jgi:hypothetical protein
MNDVSLQRNRELQVGQPSEDCKEIHPANSIRSKKQKLFATYFTLSEFIQFFSTVRVTAHAGSEESLSLHPRPDHNPPPRAHRDSASRTTASRRTIEPRGAL